MDRFNKTSRLLLISVALVVCVAGSVSGAPPHVIIINGKPLAQPVILADWNENVELLGSFVDNQIVKSEDLVGRPYLDLSMFWGSKWLEFVQSGQSLNSLRTQDANQRGRLYLATGNQDAAISLNDLYARKLSNQGIAILRKHGVPVNAMASPSASVMRSGRAAAIISFVLIGVAVVVLIATRKRFHWRFKVRS